MAIDFSQIDNIEVEDGEGFSSSKVLGKEQVILKALQKCLDEGAKEMGTGGTMQRVINGQIYETPIPNQQEIFINSIKMFWSLVFPMIMKKYVELCKEEMGDFTQQYKKVQEEYEEELNNIKNRFKDHKRLDILKQDKKDLKDNYNSVLLQLYKAKLDFGILIIEKENWFGEKYA